MRIDLKKLEREGFRVDQALTKHGELEAVEIYPKDVDTELFRNIVVRLKDVPHLSLRDAEDAVDRFVGEIVKRQIFNIVE